MRIASYNIHDAIGRDRRFDPERILRVLEEIDADLLALQEVTLDTPGDFIQQLERATGAQSIDGTLFERGVGRYGNLVLSRLPIAQHRHHHISWSNREPRGLIDLNIQAGSHGLRVWATHLGLGLRERAYQWQQLARLLETPPKVDLILGDFNEWRSVKMPGLLAAHPYRQVARRGFPTWPLPILALDRIFIHQRLQVRRSWIHNSPLARLASDHFPLLAEVAASPSGNDAG